MKQNNLKTFGVVAVFLLLVSMLATIAPVGAVPAGSSSILMENRIHHWIGKEYNRLSWHNEVTQEAMLKDVYSNQAGVYFPNNRMSFNEILDNKNKYFERTVNPTSGDIRIYTSGPLKGKFFFHYQNKLVGFGKPEGAKKERVMIFDKKVKPYSQNYKDYRYIRPFPK